VTLQEPLVVKDKDGRPSRGHPGGALLTVYAEVALLGGIFGVSRYAQREFLCPLIS